MTAWDVFVSFKHVDEHGRLTRDSALASEVAEFLGSRGLRVFFSITSLEDQGVAQYKHAIDDALDQCDVLVVVGTSALNLNSRWVRYEWDSFFNDVLSGVKPAGKVFVYLEDVARADLPRSLRQTQVFDHGPDAKERLYSFITNGLRVNPRLDLEVTGVARPAGGTPVVVPGQDAPRRTATSSRKAGEGSPPKHGILASVATEIARASREKEGAALDGMEQPHVPLAARIILGIATCLLVLASLLSHSSTRRVLRYTLDRLLPLLF